MQNHEVFLKSTVQFISSTWIIGLQHCFSEVCQIKGHKNQGKINVNLPSELVNDESISRLMKVCYGMLQILFVLSLEKLQLLVENVKAKH